MGGIAGHAGLFSNVIDTFTLLYTIMYQQETIGLLNATTVSLFTKEYNHSQSSRALGYADFLFTSLWIQLLIWVYNKNRWNTNDPTVVDEGIIFHLHVIVGWEMNG